ncbi:uncharacterized protein LOC134856233 [Symsagittifera roscoffensis]|uniref:uncharacterized protein LOC134856233 n=1 Tax=Symsagittifera roscoffensis TaxID=84072 RepID=UPI00307C545F
MTMAMACSPTSAKRRKHDTTSSGDGSDPNCSNDVFYIPVKGQYYYNLVSALYKQLCVHNGDVALFEELQGSLGSTQSANNQDNESALSSLIKTDHQNENQHNSEDNNAPPSTPALAETPPASPGPQDDNLDLNFGDHGDFADTSIAAFLNRIGCSYAIECFMSRNILHTGELAHLADHEIIGMNLDEVTQSKILQAKRDLAANGSLTNSTYPSQQFSNFDDPGDQLMVVRTASNSSMTILPNGDMRQTRYTLHHSVSFLKSAGNSFELKNNSSLI